MFQARLKLSALTLAVALVTLAGCCDFEIETTSLPSGTKGQPYSFDLESKCGDADWFVLSGQLPPGLGLDSRRGRLSGNPSLAGIYTFTLEARLRSSSSNDVISRGYAVEIETAAGDTLKAWMVRVR